MGGGIGSTPMLLANAFPHLRFVIQDRPPVVAMGAAVCSLSPSDGLQRVVANLVSMLGMEG